MARCIFCGTDVRKAARTKEHVLPMWLLRATGDPNRDIRIEFDQDTGADIIRPASTFHFPACEVCNRKYGRNLETKAQQVVSVLSSTQMLSVSQCYCLLDWLDKVRIGLWLGYHALHKEIFEPNFHIDSRLGKKDRLAIISVDPNDKSRSLGIGGCDNNVFRTSQSGMFLRINNIRIVSASFDFLVSPLAGLPHPKELFVRASDMQIVGSVVDGDHEMRQDWMPFTKSGGSIIAQPIFTLSPEMLHYSHATLDMYLKAEVIGRLKNKPTASKLKKPFGAYQMQLISSSGGHFRYFSNKHAKLRFGPAGENSDAAFMHALYAIFMDPVLKLHPMSVLQKDGRKSASPLCVYLRFQKVVQIVLRCEQLGIHVPKDDLIDELHRWSRIREEIEAHSHGTLEPGSERPWIS